MSYYRLLTNEIVPENISIGNINTSQVNGSKNASLLYNGKKFTIQLSNLHCPFPISTPKNAMESVGGKAKETLALTCPPELQKHLDELHKKVINDVYQHDVQRKCFKPKNNGMPYTMADIGDLMFNPSIKPSMKKVIINGEETKVNNQQYDPTIRINLPKSKTDDTYLFKTYDKNRKEVDLATLNLKNSRVSAVVTPSVWFNPTNFGVSYKVIQLQVFESTRSRGNVKIDFAFKPDIDRLAKFQADSHVDSNENNNGFSDENEDQKKNHPIM